MAEQLLIQVTGGRLLVSITVETDYLPVKPIKSEILGGWPIDYYWISIELNLCKITNKGIRDSFP